MIRDIPPRLLPDSLILLFNEKGFNGHYDFFYLPEANLKGQRKKKNGCFAFINFIHPIFVCAFEKTFKGFDWAAHFESCESKKKCILRFAEL